MNKVVQKLFKSNISESAKAGIWFVICNLLQKGISIITVPIFTRLLTTEEYGYYSIYLSWLNIISVFTSLNLYYGVFNNAMMKYKDDRNVYVSSMQGLTITITGFAFGCYLLGKNFFNNVLGMTTILVVLMFLELLVMPAFQFWGAKQRFENKYKLLVGVTLAKSFLNPLLGVTAVILSSGNKANARVFSTVIIEVAFCGTIMIYQFIKGKKFYVKQYWKYAFFFNLPLLPHYLSGTILNQADRVMIRSMVGNSQAGIYTVAYNLGMLIQLFLNAINASFTPWFYVNLKENNIKGIKKVSNMLLVLMAVLILGLMFFAPEAIRIFATSDYLEAIHIIPPIATSVFFIFLYTFFSNIEFYYECKKFIIIASIIPAVLNIILNYIFIKLFGYIAVGYTTLICYIIFTLCHLIFSRKVYKKNNQNEYCFDIRFIAIISIVVILFGIFVNLIYDYYLIRYLLAFILILICCIKRKTIIDYLKIIRKKS